MIRLRFGDLGDHVGMTSPFRCEMLKGPVTVRDRVSQRMRRRRRYSDRGVVQAGPSLRKAVDSGGVIRFHVTDWGCVKEVMQSAGLI